MKDDAKTKAKDEKFTEHEADSMGSEVRLTMQEWVRFWKFRYDSANQKVVLAQQWIEKTKEKLSAMGAEIDALRAKLATYETKGANGPAGPVTTEPVKVPEVPEAVVKAFKRAKAKK